MDQTLKNKIDSLEIKGDELQKQAKYKQALDVYQQLLDMNKNMYGIHSEQYEQTSIKLCQLCNIISMILLQKLKYDVCLLFLKKAQSYCLKRPKQTAMTYNNYACHYRKTGKHRTALMYLQSALQLEWKEKNNNTLADTYLNLCAVLSQLGRHNQALQNALFSVTLLQSEILGSDQKTIDRVPVLAIAYHNMAVQLEYLKRNEQSIATYEKAVSFARGYLGEMHSLTKNLQNVLKNALEGRDSAQKQEKRRTQNREKIDIMKKTYKRDERPKTGLKSMKKF